MSGQNTPYIIFTPAEEASAVYAEANRKRIVEALDSGSLCCLPDSEGYVDTTPAVNIIENSPYHGRYQLLLKDHQKQHGFPTAEYGTTIQFYKADVLKKNSQGITIVINVDGKIQSLRLYNIAQAVHPGAVRDYAAHVPQQSSQFTANMKNAVFEKNQAGHINPYNLNVICNQASAYCKRLYAGNTIPGQKKTVPRTKQTQMELFR